MKDTTRSLVILNAALLLGLTSLASVSACSTNMSSVYTSSVSPTPLGAKSLAPEWPACSEEFRPLRVAFIVDNTASNNASPDEVQTGNDLLGTDPLKSFSENKYLLRDSDMSHLTNSDAFTDRQVAVYKSILKLQRAADAAKKKDASFAGIDVGVAHFPFAPPNQPVGYKSTTSDLKTPVFHNGAGTGLSDAMTNLANVVQSPDWNSQIWNMLKFTHYTRGMTPYVTAFHAAKELLVSEKNKRADDTRLGLMILLTDGLPTERIPSEISKARTELGKDTRVVLMSVYAADENDEKQNASARQSLEALYNDTSFKWGQEEYSSFSAYWNALLQVPRSPEVRDDYIQIRSNLLLKSLDGVLDRYISCKPL
ncbi:MAG: hypothetical protein RIR26_1144 [Pseudomonadota bacterium]|jgi:hypothetical protein